jgi:glycerol-3-phosphate acyltransferase PlsY
MIAYLAGSIPFGLVLSELFGKGNLRKKGSKNIGATNVLRTQGKVLGFLTFFLDFLKGMIPCYFLESGNEIVNLMIIAAPVLGHIFPVWLKFKGGKGVATFFGVICAMHFSVFIGAVTMWIAVFAITKISSIAGLVSILFSCLIFFLVSYCSFCGEDGNFHQLYVVLSLAVIIFIKHHDNIKRLVNKKEMKI